MDIFDKRFTPPSGFESGSLCCFFTDSSYYQSDYAAVMKSKMDLRVWSHSAWPEDGFTQEANQKDLALHEADNANHEAYGYMLYNPSRDHCYGSVYVNPVDKLLDAYNIQSGSVAALALIRGRVDYWIRSDCNEKTLISQLLVDWVVREWKVALAFTARGEMVERQAIYAELGLRQEMELVSKEDQSRLLLFT